MLSHESALLTSYSKISNSFSNIFTIYLNYVARRSERLFFRILVLMDSLFILPKLLGIFWLTRVLEFTVSFFEVFSMASDFFNRKIFIRFFRV